MTNVFMKKIKSDDETVVVSFYYRYPTFSGSVIDKPGLCMFVFLFQ